jgi:multidrug efflux pump subunit AcrB
MKFIKDSRVILAILILLIVIVIEMFKSIRIEQLKKSDQKKIESIGQYEENSKNNYLKPVMGKVENEINN